MRRFWALILIFFISLSIYSQDSTASQGSTNESQNELLNKQDSEDNSKSEISIWESNLVGIGGSILIALIGGIFTFIISMRQVRNENNKLIIETDKLRAEIRAFHSEKILEKRIDCFPVLFEIISLFTKKKFEGNIPISELEDLLEKVNTWHAKNAIFFSPYTAYAFVQMRDAINGNIANGESSESKKSLYKYVDKLKIALCTDIGIYAAEFGLSPKRFENFEDIGKYAVEFEEGKVKYVTK